ncbi:MAG TPA: ABC transporter permease [bacterium]|nr:ABC transporter permease [bacterium]
MRRIAAVAEYIFKQSFRNKILNVLILFAVFSIGFSLVVSELAQEVEIKMIKDFGLFAINLFAFLTLALALTVQLFEENELKTINLIMVKPVARHEYIAGKYLGIVFTILMNVILMLAALMLILWLKGENPWELGLLLQAMYIFLGTAVLASTAMILSVLATSVPGCIIFLFFFYILGHLTVHLKNIASQLDNALFQAAADIIYYLLPNLELFNLKDKIYTPEGLFSPQYLLPVIAYAVFYPVLSLVIASLIFRKKEFF